MDCKEAVTMFPDYLDGGLEPKAHTRFEKHLKGCAFCTGQYRTYRRAIEVFRETQIQDIPEEYSTRLRKYLAKRLNI